jgi:hypothetical protein
MDFHSIFTDMQPDPLLITTGDNTTLYGSGVDMADYPQGVVFLAIIEKGEVANWTLKVQQDTASGFGTVADLAGSAKVIATAVGTDGFGFVEVKNPQERYVRPALVCPDVTTAKKLAIIAIRYGNKYLPETNSDGKLLVAPAEGTA